MHFCIWLEYPAIPGLSKSILVIYNHSQSFDETLIHVIPSYVQAC